MFNSENTKKPEWWLADLLRRVTKEFELLTHMVTSQLNVENENSSAGINNETICISFSHLENEVLNTINIIICIATLLTMSCVLYY